MKAIRTYAGEKGGYTWSLARMTETGFVLSHSSNRGQGVRFSFKPGRNPGLLTFAVSGEKAAVAVSLVVTALVNTKLRAIIESIEIVVPQPKDR